MHTNTARWKVLAFSMGEFSKHVGVCRSFLYQEIRAGRLVTCKVGRRRLVRAADGEAWLARHVVQSTSAGEQPADKVGA
jgi:excisionase family DNA binding protein